MLATHCLNDLIIDVMTFTCGYFADAGYESLWISENTKKKL